ncbi:thioredoxin family protein [Breoghania sp. L-A4]|uniref:thioredoxin family protein n=1 Tax=Breoghania sp. L-A4 TaxID=2304600 RepID=UPI000E359D29|nr:thioredoxin family protein [Breoghania sp. L-A4]AXS40522.1 thioredoxin family protein [Breoghania sp. L-A4]
MSEVETPRLDVGRPAVAFDLPATDGRRYRFGDVAGEKGTVVAFICNHCPYVQAMIDRLAEDARELMDEGIGCVAICANDEEAYPADSFPKMIEFAATHALPFPYLHDEDQSVARAFGAVCTPDLFGFDAKGMLRYRGRLDGGRAGPVPEGTRRELVEAMRQIARTGEGPVEQMPSMGCSIKWKEQ